MKNKHLLDLIALSALLLITSAAGSARAAGLAARPELEINYTWDYYGDASGDQLGYAVAGAGDVNGDGKADILVGAATGGEHKGGEALLFLGPVTPTSDTPDWEVSGEVQGWQFGAALDGAGDVNGDGYADIIIGAANYKVDLAGQGAAYLYLGSATGPALTEGWMVEGEMKNAYMGTAVAGAGDIDDDGYADVLVGIPGYTDIYGHYGAVYMYKGSEDGLGDSRDWYAYGSQEDSQFGMEVNSAGDVNGDGYEDVLVGAPRYDHYDGAYTFYDAGAVYLYLGDQYNLSMDYAWSYIGYRGGDILGTSAASAGDLNNDGCADIAIGAPGYNTGGLLDTGRVYVFYGCQETVSGLNNEPDWEYTYEQAYAKTGIDVSSAGDTNDDGYDELLVGAHLFDDEQANEGAVWAFFGCANGIASQPVWLAEGNKNDTYFGFAVDGAGDTNGDGYADVVIGAPTFRIVELNKGAAFLYFGTPEEVLTQYFTFLPFLRH
jgi:hypothetical protein